MRSGSNEFQELSHYTGEPLDQAHLLAKIPKHETMAVFIANNIKRSIPTALSYDFSIGLPVLGILMTHFGRGDTAPSVTTLLGTIGFIQFAGILPSSFVLSGLFGEIEVKEKKLAESRSSGQELSALEFSGLEAEVVELKGKVSRVPKNSIVAGMVCLPTILIMAFAKPVLSALGQNQIIARTAQDFFLPYTPFFLVFGPRLAMEFVLLSSKKQFIAMLMADAVLLATIGLEYALGFQTSLGMKGMGLAYGIGTASTFLCFSAYVASHFKGYDFFKRFLSWSSKDIPEICNLLKIAGPIIITVGCDVSATLAISLIAGLLPGRGINLQNVATQYLNINTLITSSTSQTTAMMVAEQRGKAKAGGSAYDSVRRVAHSGLLANFLLQLPLAVFVAAAPQGFQKLIGSSENESDTYHLLWLTVVYALIDGLRYNMLQAARSVGDNATPSIASSISLWIGVLLSYVLSMHTELGVLGLPTGLAIGATLGTVFLVNRLERKIDPTALEIADHNAALQENSAAVPTTAPRDALVVKAVISAEAEGPLTPLMSSPHNDQ